MKQEPWPPSYASVLALRQRLALELLDPMKLAYALEYYRTRPVEFISVWCDTFDPRNALLSGMVRMPFVLFTAQRNMVQFLQACLAAETDGLIEKSRDMGATWLCCAYSVWLWLFTPGAAIGWGSRKADLVDELGVMNSIFEKIRVLIKGLPPLLLPDGFAEEKHMHYMRIINPANGAMITGESGDDIGRGGRTLLYFKDESAHYGHPEAIEAALSENTRTQIDISSVHGLGNVFHRKREAGVDWIPGTPAARGHTNVFVLDWRDHPGKTEEWYAQKRSKAEEEGLLHIFYQEVDRNYAASVEGVIIPADWVVSAIDAHKKIKHMHDGPWMAALDVADGGGDRNAFGKRKGVVLQMCDEWGERDTGKTARRAVSLAAETLPIEVQYDSIGVGSGVKAETNRLIDEGILPRGLRFISWDAGARPLNPDGRVVEDDDQSPLNKDFYMNFKAQGWWMLRRRFEKTHRAITEGVKFRAHELISLPSVLPRLRQLQKELSQPTVSKSASRLKLVVDKQPEGSRSPNLGDMVMMCYWPADDGGYDDSMSWVA